jgi:hypothetical protein
LAGLTKENNNNTLHNMLLKSKMLAEQFHKNKEKPEKIRNLNS